MSNKSIPRRDLLKAAGVMPAMALLAGCQNSDGPKATSSGPLNGPGATPAAGSSAAVTRTGSSTQWAAGGADLITADFPETTIFSTANTCKVDLTGSATEGPCYFQVDTGADIAQGRTGVPMQLCARVVNKNCEPLEGYTVEVWQCDARGKYSGNTSGSDDAGRFKLGFCTENDAEAKASNYLRGQQKTDSDGRVNFKSVFPGWYAGRVIHIHFAVSDSSGKRRLVSQWVFPEELCTDICTNHELYSQRGKQDTPLAKDGLVPADGGNQLLSTRRNSDGSLLAYGVIQVE